MSETTGLWYLIQVHMPAENCCRCCLRYTQLVKQLKGLGGKYEKIQLCHGFWSSGL